jgi:serine phosphatase RsbU (regulator of sigma subunit)
MSMVGINALNNIIERGIADSDQILEALDTEIRNTLQQESSGNSDGMDISLGIYRKEKNTLEFSGAKNPLVYIQNKELYQIKGNARSIGGKKSKNSNPFSKHLILIDQPTTFYLFTDGYRDQFGDQDKGKFLTKRFNQLLLDIHELSLQEQKIILENTLKEWRGETHQIDDVLVLGVKLEPNK